MNSPPVPASAAPPRAGVVAPSLAAARAHYAAGRREICAWICRQLLAREPDHPGASHLLGRLALDAGDTTGGLELIARAAATDPADADLRFDHAAALASAGRAEE